MVDIAVMYRRATNAPAVKQVTLIKKFGAFVEETAVLIEANFKRSKVQYLVITLYLSKVRDEGHVHSETIADTILHIHATIDRCFPTIAHVSIAREVSRKIRRERKPDRGFDILEACPVARLVHKPKFGRINRAP